MKHMMLAAILAGVSLTSAEDIATTTGEIYKDATIIRADTSRATIKHAYGISQVPIVSLSAEWQKRLGYNPQATAPTPTTPAAIVNVSNSPSIPQESLQAANALTTNVSVRTKEASAPGILQQSPPTATTQHTRVPVRSSTQSAPSPPQSRESIDSGNVWWVFGVLTILVLISWSFLAQRSSGAAVGTDSGIEQSDAAARCPKCGSPSVFGQKQGYGAGKGCLGAIATGGLGLLCGFCGSRKMYAHCLRCGHKWRLN